MSPSQPFRRPDGGCIDRSRPLRFTFNDRSYEGYVGDTLASALLANGVRTVTRSFKFHRPRGIFSAGFEEPNGLLGVDVGSGMIPITCATLMPLIDGLRAETQNSFPSLKFDFGRLIDYTRSLWPVGFYNKIFKWPSWNTFEWAVRKTAGLGVLPDGEDNSRYRHVNTHCDVLVVGAGSAGLKAAVEAARRGEDVLLVEQDVEAGGSLLFDPTSINGHAPGEFLAAALKELRAAASVRIMVRSTVAGYYDHNVLTIHDQSAAYRGDASVETYWKARAKRVVLATGAIEQPLMFGNNDLPGIMLSGAMLQYANRYAVLGGRRIVAVVNNDLAWRTVLALQDAGVQVCSIVDVRGKISGDLVAAAKARGIACLVGATPLQARGSRVVRALQVATSDSKTELIKCDGIAVSGGLNPTVHLFSQAGGKLRYDQSRACFVPDHCPQAVEIVGAANGDFVSPENYRIASRTFAPVSTTTQWVDYLHDVTVSDLELSVRENFVSVEHLKRYTTTGMAVDQGKTSNLNTLSVLAQLTGRQPGELGTTTFRPQFMPVTLGAIAGNRRSEFYAPCRQLPNHNWHITQGAVFDDYGGWKRPAFYGADRDASIRSEVLKVRQAAGLFDASPLGKIEVKGPDAAEFLSMMYVNTVHTLKEGKVRYGLMLNENGVVIDDGVFVRLAEEHFLVSTTSGAATRIAMWLEEWRQCEFSNMQVIVSAVTEQWAVATVAGPKARRILESLPGMVDLGTESFPHMSFASGSFEGDVPFRILRVSYSGECSFEFSVPSNHGEDCFRRIMDIGEPYGLAAVGIEAILALRIEKGFLHVGVDTDGMTNALDVGFGGIIANKKTDFVGARSLQRAEDQRSDRRQLIGFEVENGTNVVAGAHFVGNRKVRRSEGFVTSACESPTLGKTIGLGLLERGFDRKGETIEIFDENRIVSARVVDACFYDPDGERMRG